METNGIMDFLARNPATDDEANQLEDQADEMMKKQQAAQLMEESDRQTASDALEAIPRMLEEGAAAQSVLYVALGCIAALTHDGEWKDKCEKHLAEIYGETAQADFTKDAAAAVEASKANKKAGDYADRVVKQLDRQAKALERARQTLMEGFGIEDPNGHALDFDNLTIH